MIQANDFHSPAQAKHGRSSRGQSIVELALLLPALVVLVAGIVDLGRIYYSYIAVINVAREGARFAAAHPPSGCDPNATGLDRIKTRALEEALNNRMDVAQLKIGVYCFGPENNTDVGSTMRVTVQYNFRMLAAGMLYGTPPVPIRYEVKMQIFGR